jgi:acyl carrier protein
MKRTLFEIIKQLQIDSGIEPSTVINDDDDLINDLGFDSLNLAELTVIIEDEYGVDIFEKKIIRKIYEIKQQINE